MRRVRGRHLLWDLGCTLPPTKGHRKWSVLQSLNNTAKQVKTVGPTDMPESLLKLRGEEEWSRGSGFTLPKGVVRTDPKWTLSREALAAINRQYRNRLIYGPQWRADIVTAVERGGQPLQPRPAALAEPATSRATAFSTN